MSDEHRLRGVLADLDTVHAAVSDFSRRHGVPDDVSTPMRLALDELITNVVEHGFAGVALDQRRLVLRLSASAVDVQARIEDNGIPFDPTAAAPAEPAGALDDRPIGGLGLHLVRRSIDRMHYRRDGEYNVVTIAKRLP